jgi:hypothetical protein
MKERPTPRQMRATVDRFNRAHKPGDTIRFRPVHGESHSREVQIREPGAVLLEGHTPVVYVTGGHGCVAISHVVEKIGAR